MLAQMVPLEWAGRPHGGMRRAKFPFACRGHCQRMCAAGTLAQLHHDNRLAGSRAYRRTCEPCSLLLLEISKAPNKKEVPLEWAGRPTGRMRREKWAFMCFGPCKRKCAKGTLVQLHYDDRLAGSRAWRRMCEPCDLRLRARRARARSLWAKARRYYYVRCVLACGLRRAHARAAERAYAPGGAGYAEVRDDFSACASAQMQ